MAVNATILIPSTATPGKKVWNSDTQCGMRTKKVAIIRPVVGIRDLDKSKIGTVRYKFGSNHLYIGEAIIKALEHLEGKYGLDFNELTKQKR